MGDDRTKRGKPDRIRINVGQAHERRYWCKRFGITAVRLKEAVEAAGPMTKSVRKYLIYRLENS